jgi:hypothetical protein
MPEPRKALSLPTENHQKTRLWQLDHPRIRLEPAESDRWFSSLRGWLGKRG